MKESSAEQPFKLRVCAKALPGICRVFMLFLIVSSLLSTGVRAADLQMKKVTGTITDAKTGVGVPGANVLVVGSSTGTSSDANGKYSIDVPDANSKLEFSSLGYVSQTVTVGNQSVIDVALTTDVTSLDEVVVVGYGSEKKINLTSAISSIAKDKLNLGGTTANAAMAIQGRAAGVMVSQGSFAPGAQAIIRVRGGNSIKSTNEPLYVVDGFPSSTGMDINPNDIEDIQILKDASATAIYGARGANGVIMITTKRGRAGKTDVQYDGYYGVQQTQNPFQIMTGLESMQVANAKADETGKVHPYNSADLANGNNNDWFKLATRLANVQSHNLNASGGNEDTRISFSGNYFSQDGVLKNTDYTRYTSRLNIDKKFSEKFKVGGNVNYGHSFSNFKTYDGNIVPSNVMYGLITQSQAVPYLNADGTYARFKGRDNPMAWLMLPTNERFTDKFSIAANAEYKIVKNLSFNVNGGTEYQTTKEGTYLPTGLVSGQDVGGRASVTDLAFARSLVEAYFNFYKEIGGVHKINAVAGVSSQIDNSDRHYSEVQKFSTDAFLYYNLGAASERTFTQTSRIQTKMSSAYGRLNYSLLDKYLATFTLRADASSRFGPNNRVGYFPSGSVAWRILEEDFMSSLRNTNVLSNLKLRASYGVTGNDRIPDYLYLTTFVPTRVTLDGSNSYAGTTSGSLPNPNLKWESTAQLDIGLDMGFFDNRITSTIDYYRKKTSDLLFDIPIGDWNGFASQTVNAGAIENHGVEWSINSENVISKNFNWSTSLNMAYNKQSCLDLGGRPYIITQIAAPYGGRGIDYTKLEVGRELSEIWGYKYKGVFKTGDDRSAQPGSKVGDAAFVDVSGDGKITAADRTYLGNATPHFIFGLNNDFKYKGFTLNLFFQGATGYNLFNVGRYLLETGVGVDALNRWTTTNENTDIPRDGYLQAGYGFGVVDKFVEDASYLRLKVATLSYDFKIGKGILKSVRTLKVYVTGQNLLTLTKYKGADPEVNTRGGNANLAAGEDYTAFPAYRILTFGVQLNF
jgi:TonB-linked SusC/RagA family outer membrane protein